VTSWLGHSTTTVAPQQLLALLCLPDRHCSLLNHRTAGASRLCFEMAFLFGKCLSTVIALLPLTTAGYAKHRPGGISLRTGVPNVQPQEDPELP